MLVVQCKNHTAPVSPSVVRELYGVLLHEEADGAVLVATGGFSNAAKEFAEGKPITLLDSSDVFRMEKGIAPSFSFFDETSARNT
jgi:restriction system protein